jgi:preprotein translocase subunit SecF
MTTKNSNNDFGKFDFASRIGLFGGISLALVIISLLLVAFKGIKYGIDFAGGTEMQIRFAQTTSIDQLRGSLGQLNLPGFGIQSFGDQNEFIIRFQAPEGKDDRETNENQNKAAAQIKEIMDKELAAQQPEIRSVGSVGPQVGAELKRSGLLAVFYCLLAILIYVSLRFDARYAPGAVICLAHDAIITLGIFVLTGREVNIAIVASILTLIGFSLNDTIVVFDRIRETEPQYREKGTKWIINKSINDMIWRSLITSGTTFVSSLALLIFADGAVEDIAFAMCIGIVFGTYSSIYVAAPFMLLVEKFKAKTSAA